MIVRVESDDDRSTLRELLVEYHEWMAEHAGDVYDPGTELEEDVLESELGFLLASVSDEAIVRDVVLDMIATPASARVWCWSVFLIPSDLELRMICLVGEIPTWTLSVV
jgi:hypothetical protein